MVTLSAGDLETVGGSTDRRKESRNAVNVRARLKSLDPVTSTGPSTVVQVIEIARHGLKIFAHRLIHPGGLVQVTMFQEVITGKVRHCTAVGGGFHLGIERAKFSF